MVLARRRPERSIPVGLEALRKVRSALLHDNALRAYALRLAVAVGAGSLLYRLVDLPHGYWVPLTTLAILQPTEHGTLLRSLQRVAGTLLAAALIVGVLLATDNPWLLVACAAATAFLLYALDERGYFWLVVLLTPTVLLMISAVDFEGDTVALDRVADTMLGIVIGLAFGELATAPARIPRRSPTFEAALGEQLVHGGDEPDPLVCAAGACSSGTWCSPSSSVMSWADAGEDLRLRRAPSHFTIGKRSTAAERTPLAPLRNPPRARRRRPACVSQPCHAGPLPPGAVDVLVEAALRQAGIRDQRGAVGGREDVVWHPVARPGVRVEALVLVAVARVGERRLGRACRSRPRRSYRLAPRRRSCSRRRTGIARCRGSRSWGCSEPC